MAPPGTLVESSTKDEDKNFTRVKVIVIEGKYTGNYRFALENELKELSPLEALGSVSE